jgi:hypothetical protein
MNNCHKIPPQRPERRSNYVRLHRSSEPGRRHLPGTLLRYSARYTPVPAQGKRTKAAE